ncbi:MAG: D-aminoacyl-tRNA deacylase [Candidatus Latescibacteria bacterium]|jgi:D-tyrosyl-tRNA(Tyr) deacylase|nr:D-aminoacyl-tRNA deacylase [Candidatus Latescibacterota bacterium]
MRALIQRVLRSAVYEGDELRSEIGQGLLILLGVGKADDEGALRFVAEKCANLRIFEDDAGKMNRSLLDVQGEAMVVSQFTLYGDTRKGRRPGFTDAASPDIAEATYERFVEVLRELGLSVKTGVFGAHMQVHIENDGPVTLLVENP